MKKVGAICLVIWFLMSGQISEASSVLLKQANIAQIYDIDDALQNLLSSQLNQHNLTGCFVTCFTSMDCARKLGNFRQIPLINVFAIYRFDETSAETILVLYAGLISKQINKALVVTVPTICK